MSDESRSVQTGHLRQAFQQFEGPLLGYAARLTGDAESARDVVQEVFLRLCREAADLNGRMPQWLFSVCRNLAIDAKRKGGRMTTVTAMTPAMEAALAAPADSPGAVPEGSHVSDNLLALLDALPENQQEVIRLRLGASLSYRQIAEVTGLSVTNVGFLMHTGLKTLRERMGSA